MTVQVLGKNNSAPRVLTVAGSRWISLVLLTVMVLIAIFPAAPVLYRTPGTDYSIFLYVGREVAAGRLPYLQAYDHKPPLIFYLDAFGLLVAGGSRWGIWALQFISLLAATWLAYFFLQRFFGRIPALLSCLILLANLALVHQRGNLTEEYALPFQFGALVLLADARQSRKPGWRYFLLGVLLGLASSLKQPLAGIGLGMLVFLILEYCGQHNWRGLIRSCLFIGLGGLSVWLFWFSLYLAQGIFPEFWEAAFLMNFGYSSFSTPDRIQFLRDAFIWMVNTSPFFVGAMLIWLTLLPFLLFNNRRILPLLSGSWIGVGGVLLSLFFFYKGLFRAGLQGYALNQLSSYRVGLLVAGLLILLFSVFLLTGWTAVRLKKIFAPLLSDRCSPLALPLIVALIDLPLEFVLATLAGRNFPHYFLPLLPSLAILFAYAIHSLLTSAVSLKEQATAYTWLGALLIPLLLPGLILTVRQLHPHSDSQVEDVAAYIQKNTLLADPVMQWGITPAVYIQSGRSSSTRFFHVNTLFFDGYSGIYQTSRLLQDLTARPPLLIFDAQMTRLPLVTAPGWQDCDKVKDPAYYREFTRTQQEKEPGVIIPQMPQGIGEVYFWICQNYTPVGAVGELNWQIYRLRGK